MSARYIPNVDRQDLEKFNKRKSLNTIFKKESNLITVSDGVEVNIVVVGREEEKGKPGDKSIPDKTRD